MEAILWRGIQTPNEPAPASELQELSASARQIFEAARKNQRRFRGLEVGIAVAGATFTLRDGGASYRIRIAANGFLVATREATPTEEGRLVYANDYLLNPDVPAHNAETWVQHKSPNGKDGTRIPLEDADGADSIPTVGVLTCYLAAGLEANVLEPLAAAGGVQLQGFLEEA